MPASARQLPHITLQESPGKLLRKAALEILVLLSMGNVALGSVRKQFADPFIQLIFVQGIVLNFGYQKVNNTHPHPQGGHSLEEEISQTDIFSIKVDCDKWFQVPWQHKGQKRVYLENYL